MNSVSTETTEYTDSAPPGGWIFYDRDCGFCSDGARRLTGFFARHGFIFVPLQERWIQERLGLSREEALAEMRVLAREGESFAGADAIIFLAQRIWWARPVSWFAQLPGARRILQALYRWVAAHRTCTIGTSKRPPLATRTRWLPLLGLVFLAFAGKPLLPAWGFMWAMAVAIFIGCKWLTLGLAQMRLPDVSISRAAAYMLAWPGMDAARFLSPMPSPTLPISTFLKSAATASARTMLGILLLFGVARQVAEPLLVGWIAMLGIVLILHFGLFDLVSLAWRKVGIDAPPIMDAPLRSRSIAEFWSRRWNGAFNQLALRLVFRPVARLGGVTLATLAAFGASGLVHELVISVPANGGYGFPTAYFLLQGAALLVERRLGASWLFTMIVVAGPAFWLFHPPFVERVILPFMRAIGAL